MPVETLPKINVLKETLKLQSIKRIDKNLIKELEALDFESP